MIICIHILKPENIFRQIFFKKIIFFSKFKGWIGLRDRGQVFQDPNPVFLEFQKFGF